MCRIKTRLDVDGDVRKYTGDTFIGSNLEGDNIDSMIVGEQAKICQCSLLLFFEILDRVGDAEEFATVMTALSVMKDKYGEDVIKMALEVVPATKSDDEEKRKFISGLKRV